MRTSSETFVAFTFRRLVRDDGRLPPHVPEGPDDGLVLLLTRAAAGACSGGGSGSGQLSFTLPTIKMGLSIEHALMIMVRHQEGATRDGLYGLMPYICSFGPLFGLQNMVSSCHWVRLIMV